VNIYYSVISHASRQLVDKFAGAVLFVATLNVSEPAKTGTAAISLVCVESALGQKVTWRHDTAV
jgi:hypothetical protein